MARLILLLAIPAMLAGVALALVRLLWSLVFSESSALRIAIAFDQLFNAAANGSEDETVSSRAARARDAGRRWGCVLCRLLDKIDPGHCDKSRGV